MSAFLLFRFVVSGLDSGPEPFEDLVPVFLGLRLEDLADPLAASRDIHRVAP